MFFFMSQMKRDKRRKIYKRAKTLQSFQVLFKNISLFQAVFDQMMEDTDPRYFYCT